ncbi:serine/threonine/dual specificity protein kinase, catalytic domain-containing protein [Artemisia annua]|uniref:Serine/threonine/dual specificity protein kinase, catalytic domain-containing protein n=1 Tax=Artemisia annua TaxID=35608 RepID=A0A2U1QPG5_ARTAN|nr:serine/threonine/dual specificity protein kinase, catalytic domain-containing protein [Artemisia annua]
MVDGADRRKKDKIRVDSEKSITKISNCMVKECTGFKPHLYFSGPLLLLAIIYVNSTISKSIKVEKTVPPFKAWSTRLMYERQKEEYEFGFAFLPIAEGVEVIERKNSVIVTSSAEVQGTSADAPSATPISTDDQLVLVSSDAAHADEPRSKKPRIAAKSSNLSMSQRSFNLHYRAMLSKRAEQAAAQATLARETLDKLYHEDSNWEAMISDIGLSKIGPTNQPSTYVNTMVRGTFGYLDPNYFHTGRLTRKSDVYPYMCKSGGDGF